MRRGASGLVLLVLVACTASRVKPEANITIAGSVQRGGGKPVADAAVSLVREGDVGDVFITVTTLGLACLAPEPKPGICSAAQTTTTGSNGRFDYKLKGRDTQATFGMSAVLALTTAIEAKDLEIEGSSTTYRFHAQTERLDLPVRLWEPSLAARTGSFGARVAFPRFPSGLLPTVLRRSALSYAIEFTRGSEPVWRIDKASPATRFDPRVLEDSTGVMRVIAGANRLDVVDTLGDEVALAMRSGAREYASPLDPPPSRGRPCTIPDAEGRPVSQAPCRLTDGEFAEGFRPSACAGATGCTEPSHGEAMVDLGATMPIDLLVLRGCPDTCRVETSPDARRWRLAGVATSEQASLAPAGQRRERYVRISGPVDRLTEVSVWSGTPRIPDASLLVAPSRFPTTSPGRGGDPAAAPPSGADDDQGVWPLIATGLLGAVAGGLFVALTRRRRRSHQPG